ncbi:putative disease resistance protein [Vitis vinifera]|uniref:Putative disease resistance protein n=1 Tax=Vitis vinifera TaxID=29760 RepID=A0A438GZP9_VITVI|nr:putative disease resistance protein [Vitis vinifera]
MEFLGSIAGLIPCFYDHTSRHTLYIRDLKKNLRALSQKMEELNNLYEDVTARVEGEEQRQMRRRKEVGGLDPWSRRNGGRISEKLVSVSDQIGRGHFDVVAEMLPRPLVDELPMEETVGSELAYDRICGFLKDPQVRIMGLYGMGASKIREIQDVIWNKLQLSRDGCENRSSRVEKAAEILRVLKTKKFVLLLDDIWERLDLLEMGSRIPMLETKAAWTLFQKEVGEETLKSHPHIPRLAKIVAEECNGFTSRFDYSWASFGR